MTSAVATLVAVTLAVLALIHIYWALGGKASVAAVPETDGRPAFTPSRAATFLVAAGLLAAAYVVAAAGHLVADPLRSWNRLVAFGLAALFFARAVGDFRLVGFFKRASPSRFARLDTTLYSPLCLGLALATGYVACQDV